jgi:hypothetical protein
VSLPSLEPAVALIVGFLTQTREANMALQHSHRHFTSGGFIPLGIGALLGFVAANVRSARNAVNEEARPSRAGAPRGSGQTLMSRPPLDRMNTYLNAFHFYADDMGRQVEAHHYCSHLYDDLHQCVIYDSDEPNARLIGIEYIVTERLFRQLPEDEKRLWHSHHYEVKSGQLVEPKLSAMAEHEAMRDLVSTYGKTFHNWQFDRDDLPLGIPQLMMGFTRDGQANPDLIRARDRRWGISTDEKRQNRADIPMPSLVPGANAWESGQSLQTDLRTVQLRNLV